MVEAQYELLKLTPPFTRWKLPPADDVIFKITNAKDREAHFVIRTDGTDPEIAVSNHHINTLDQLAQALAHEMVHLYMDLNKINGGPTGHGFRFQRLARSVCRHHCWDITRF